MYLEERLKVFKLQTEVLQLRFDQMQKAITDTERALKTHIEEKKFEKEKRIIEMVSASAKKPTKKPRRGGKKNEKK